MPTVTVLLRTLNAGDYLEPLFNVLGRQTLEPLEILVVDSESEDDTPARAADYGARVVTIRRSKFSHAKSTNLGFRESRGDIVAMLSQDALPKSEQWLEQLVNPLANPNTAAVFGRQIPRDRCFPVERWEIEAAYPGVGESQVAYSNVNSAAKKSVWEELPFDETVAISEDRFWAEAVRKRGHHVVYSPLASVWHSHEYTLRQVYQRCRAESRARRRIEGETYGFGLLVKGWPKQLVSDGVRLKNEGALYKLPRVALYRWFQFSGLVSGGRA